MFGFCIKWLYLWSVNKTKELTKIIKPFRITVNRKDMKATKITINLYSFSELNQSAKQLAIDEQRVFELSIMQPSDFISGDDKYDTEENLEEVYNAQYKYYYENDKPIIELIEMNDYLFFFNGVMANCTTYVGSHKKTGRTELTLNGETYLV